MGDEDVDEGARPTQVGEVSHDEVDFDLNDVGLRGGVTSQQGLLTRSGARGGLGFWVRLQMESADHVGEGWVRWRDERLLWMGGFYLALGLGFLMEREKRN